jgi:hypothetical protein
MLPKVKSEKRMPPIITIPKLAKVTGHSCVEEEGISGCGDCARIWYWGEKAKSELGLVTLR